MGRLAALDQRPHRGRGQILDLLTSRHGERAPGHQHQPRGGEAFLGQPRPYGGGGAEGHLGRRRALGHAREEHDVRHVLNGRQVRIDRDRRAERVRFPAVRVADEPPPDEAELRFGRRRTHRPHRLEQ
nr:hypothetical protein [Streptomyces melanosporofaciens]